MRALVLLVGVLPSAADGQFTEVSDDSGLIAYHLGSAQQAGCTFSTALCGSYLFLGGFVVGDLDRDGDRDVVAPRLGATPLVFLSDGTGGYARRTIGLGLDREIFAGGAALFDVDRDGDLDLLITGHGDAQHFLYINELETGRLRFHEDGVARGIAEQGIEAHAAVVATPSDPDLDGDLDIYVGEWSRRGVFECGAGRGRFFRNLGPERVGHFEDATSAVGLDVADRSQSEEHSFEGVFADFDDDGWLDFWLSGDFGTSSLYWSEQGRFSRVRPPSPGMNDMGATVADFDGDGRLDIFTVGIFAPLESIDGNRLYLNTGARVFRDATDELGVRRAEWGWGAEAADMDLDGDIDLLVSSGFISADPGAGPVFLFENEGGSMTTDAYPDGLPGSVGQGRGILAEDVDNDGDLDVMVSYFDDRIRLFRNELPIGRNWMRVRVRDRHGGDGHGARVTVIDSSGRSQIRELGHQGGHTASATPLAHFGFGSLEDSTVEVRVRFLGGLEATVTAATRQEVLIEEPNAPPVIGPAAPLDASVWDCDGNGRLDACGADCDEDGIADACEILTAPALDCDGDGLLDSCGIALGLAMDCDASGVVDTCELSPTRDCDGDGRLDSCQAASVVCTRLDMGPMPVDGATPEVPRSRSPHCAASPTHRPSANTWPALALAYVVVWRMRRRRGGPTGRGSKS
ncbi:MAG: CRTAC1 family protein [Sandaracinaceae bacterium]|nr:CRTAC1 family protein [Sandaracinaceae bacterium]